MTKRRQFVLAAAVAVAVAGLANALYKNELAFGPPESGYRRHTLG